MGVYIKGMEMPKNCYNCAFLDEFGRCDVLNSTRVNWTVEEKKRDKDCPLVPVPPHGRLIDADAFTKDECNNCDGACEALPCDCLNCESDCRCDFMKDIAGAPTIIEAEEGKG